MGFISSPHFSPTYRYIHPHTFYPILCKTIQAECKPRPFQGISVSESVLSSPQCRLTVSVCAEGRVGSRAQGQLLPLGSGGQSGRQTTSRGGCGTSGASWSDWNSVWSPGFPSCGTPPTLGPQSLGAPQMFSSCAVSGARAPLMSLLTCSAPLLAWYGVLRYGDRVLGGGKRSLSQNQVFYR